MKKIISMVIILMFVFTIVYADSTIYSNSESTHFDVYSSSKCFDGNITMDSRNSGWVIQPSVINQWIKFNMPIGVVIGDSIAEGNPYSHSRLHGSQGEVNLDYPNQKGQISWYLENYLKIRVYNHGIGGQTVAQVRERWERDVLGNTVSFYPNVSLPYKASFVVVIAGINDIVQDRNIDAMKADYDYIINSAISNGVTPIICNIPPQTGISETRLQNIKTINTWLAGKNNIILIDLYKYFNDPSNDGNQKPGYGDGIHPTKYHALNVAKLIETELLNNNAAPQYINLYSYFNYDYTPNGVARPKTVNLYMNDKLQGTYILPNSPETYIKLPYINEYCTTCKIEVLDSQNPFENESIILYYTQLSEIKITGNRIMPEFYEANKILK